MDGDGKADLIIGAPGPKMGGKVIGLGNIAVMPGLVIGGDELPAPLTNRAYLFSGTGLTGGTISTANATATFTEGAQVLTPPMLGLAVAITDLNGDRLGDIVIGEPFMPTATSTGRVGIFLGKAGIAGTVTMATADLFINHDWPVERQATGSARPISWGSCSRRSATSTTTGTRTSRWPASPPMV